MTLTIGQKVAKKKIFSKEDVSMFAKLTDDYNPIHFDEDFASKTIFMKPIVHGPLVLTLITSMFANELPGPGTVYLSHELKFMNPVYVGDEITAELEVVDITPKKHIFIKTVCYNQSKEIVITGVARLKTF